LSCVGFNELLARRDRLCNKRKLLRTVQAHFFLLRFLSGVVVGTYPSAKFGIGLPWLLLGRPLRALCLDPGPTLSFGGLWEKIYLITGILLDGGKRIAPSAREYLQECYDRHEKGMAYSGFLMAILYVLSMISRLPPAQHFMASSLT